MKLKFYRARYENLLQKLEQQYLCRGYTTRWRHGEAAVGMRDKGGLRQCYVSVTMLK